MGDFDRTHAACSLERIPSGTFAMTAAFEGARAGILVSYVQRCADEPPMVSVAVRKGRPIEPIIRDSHAFALCLIPPNEKFILRRLLECDEHAGNTLDPIECDSLKTGSPCIRKAPVVLDCDVARHIDLDADHELYIGLVVSARMRGEEHVLETAARSERAR